MGRTPKIYPAARSFEVRVGTLPRQGKLCRRTEGRCSQAHSRTSEPNRIGSVEAVHEGRKTRRITWSAALAEYGTI
ncbi:unnamed protein product [Microthlaspi erraticum]|uniref:Uncharacterized protein n=1 Tax=Microthlaspi erraticum TaxID=1685480 RepID=A0A6D2KSK5_9BRAS|nr:unnamed protein product [Microthlaspi erraticum]